MKYIPNSLSILRILFSVSLLFLNPFQIHWLLVYYICGLSDILDGYIARKFKLSSKTGATLDSIADLTMVVIILIVVWTHFHVPLQMIILITFLLIIKSTTLILGFLRFKTFPFLHTYSNKLAGFFVFILLPFYLISSNYEKVIFILLTLITLYATLEEFLIIMTVKKFNPNQSSIFITMR